MKLKFLTYGLLFILFLTLGSEVPVLQSQPNTTTASIINGISYSHGQQNFTTSGNVTHTDNSFVSEANNATASNTTNLPLVKSIAVADIYYHLREYENTSTNATWMGEQWFNNQTYWSNYYVFLTQTMPARFDANITLGLQQENIVVTENYSTVQSLVVEDNIAHTFLGQYPTPTTLVQYNHMYLNGTVHRRSVVLSSDYFIVHVTRQIYPVKVQHTEYTAASLFFASRVSVAYNISASANVVNITDGNHLAVQIMSFDMIHAQYIQSVVNVMAYDLTYVNYYQIKFSNGTAVPYGMYPRAMLPVVSHQQGKLVQAGYQKTTSDILSTFQSVSAIFAAVTGNKTADSLSLDARLAAWNIQTVGMLAAYSDGNNNHQLDLTLNPDGLGIASSDRLRYLGLTEAYESTTVNAYYSSNIYNSSIQYPGYGINNTVSNVNDTTLNYDVQHSGYGNLASTVKSTFIWNEPTADSSGIVTFSFGTNYNNFPVTWVNMTDPSSSFVDLENITYMYNVQIDPSNGVASIKPTWTYSGVTAADKKAAMDGLSLAFIIKSQFFALHATYTASQTNQTLDASKSTTFNSLVTSFGNMNATKVDVSGPGRTYESGGTNYTAYHTAITLLVATGQFSADSTTPFSSESSDTAGTAASGTIIQHLQVNYYYSAGLIVVNYPTWNGANITHDPSYDAYYEPNAAPSSSGGSGTGGSSSSTTSSSSSSTSTTANTTTNPTTPSPKVSSSSPKAPGFTLLFALSSIMMMTVVIRKRHK